MYTIISTKLERTFLCIDLSVFGHLCQWIILLNILVSLTLTLLRKRHLEGTNDNVALIAKGLVIFRISRLMSCFPCIVVVEESKHNFVRG